MEFRTGIVQDVLWKPLTKNRDGRGWLCELFRDDELAGEAPPVMTYASVT
jgi:dTDP-4-dehydrorhamnose 3,5-epimerase